MSLRSFKFSIDRGGTFTDVFCECENGKQRIMKLLSEDPANYNDAPTEGIRRILEEETGIPHPRDRPVDTSRIQYIRMGTTVATNALLERKGERTALITTKGFRDLQLIGNQSRPKIFELNIRRPDVLFECVEEVDERVVLLKDGEYSCDNKNDVVIGISQEALFIETPIDEEEVRAKLQTILSRGITCLAVAFMHSYTFPAHERCVETIARELGFTQISLSSTIMPMVRLVPRGCTTCVDAYLTPVLKRYLSSFCAGFDAGLAEVSVCFMQSDGGLTSMNTFLGNRSILSGPAGGVVGYALTSRVLASVDTASGSTPASPAYMPAIGFDMGGTSTDVSRYAGEFEHVFETTTAGITIQSPQLDINTVAAGGGSRLYFKNKLFTVGPESSGAHPGPICYRKNGYLSVTDANLVLGRIQPDLFPSIFGPEENLPLDAESSLTAFESMTRTIGAELGTSDYKVDEVAYGFIRVANEAMCRPIRNLTTMKGYDVTKHVLACFGGAGGQHCCAIAKSLGMQKIVVHRQSGILSAYGLSLADIVEERQEPCSGQALAEPLFAHLLQRAEVLAATALDALRSQGFTPESIQTNAFLNIRYAGTDTAIMTAFDLSCGDDLTKAVMEVHERFRASYMREYGFELTGRSLLVDDVRIRAVGSSVSLRAQADETSAAAAAQDPVMYPLPNPHSVVPVYFELVDGSCRRVATPVYLLKQFDKASADIGAGVEESTGGFMIEGPAMVIQDVATVVVEPGCSCFVNIAGNLEITVHSSGTQKVSSTVVDPIYLSIFSHRFMGIAEQMGRTLQRTSISVNIKERLDFSCALFDCHGGLVANAPHLPVHLGAMSEAVRYQVKHWMTPEGTLDIVDGDVLVSNHPQLAGGSHLPDITVITPIFQGGKIVFFVASRGHHSDIGGIAPGSMPPMSKTLVQEGAAIVAFKLVEHGQFQEDGISKLLMAPGELENNFGTRNLSDNISDLRAQVAANNRGKALVNELVNEYSLSVVQAYMLFIQEAAEAAVRRMLRSFSEERGLDTLCGSVSAVDYLDDGTPICLKISINREEGTAVFDFTGTGPEIYGNLNAPPAVTTSAVIYCLRCLLADIVDLPLNQGCLTPIRILLPQNSILNPSPTAAVVGGNVLTSQRVTDVIFRAFEAAAASQGCMNNLTFGDASMGYYETIAGGSGAGPGFHGTSGVHTHMTNTRITDPEILEKRYPVILRQFRLREGSGGPGQYRGGDGVVRELEFMKPLMVSILSERRAFQPYGMAGGESAQRGLNLLQICERNAHGEPTGEFRTISLGGKNTVQVQKLDRLTIFSPGGGGYGHVSRLPTPTGSEGGGDDVRPVMSSGSLHAYTSSQESA